MKVKDLNGNDYKINLGLYNKERLNCSSLHKAGRQLLKSLFPFSMILEEVPLPGTRMFVDFFLPDRCLLIEVQGEQHYKFNAHFFNNKMEFLKAVKRDKDKQRWAEINNLTLVALPYNEDLNEWTNRISSRNDEPEIS